LLFAIVSITMSNKVWVTWKDAAGEPSHAKVINLDDDADADDLRVAFVKQQNLTTTVPGQLKVFEPEDGGKLDEGKKLKEYFTAPSGSAAPPGPGKSAVTALFITFPPQQQNGELRCCCSRILIVCTLPRCF
jgi:hypothetical protein